MAATIRKWLNVAARYFCRDANTMAAREWQVEVLRFTFIGLSDETVKHFGSMQEFFDITPETVTNKPQQMSKTEDVAWHQGRLAIVTQPRRLDVIYSAIQQEAIAMPKGGDFVDVGNELLSLIQPVSGVKVGRIACGGVVLHMVPDAKSGYGVLSELLPFVNFNDDMREFALQVNRPKEHDGLLANELGKWSVTTMKLVQFNAANGAMSGFNGESAVRFEFDFNTADSNPVPDDADCFAILKDLFERSVEVSQEGAK